MLKTTEKRRKIERGKKCYWELSSPLPPPLTPPMFTKIFSPPLPLPFSPPRFLLQPLSFSPLSICSLYSTLDHYGPSLRKGLQPSLCPELPNYPTPHRTNSTVYPNDNATELFDETIFSRIYNIAALRVPAEHCSALERRLRGHLLNWPRIRNIARVPGDEIEEEFQNVLGKPDEANSLVTLNRRIRGKAEGDGEPLNGVLYRDKLVKNFNSKGYVNFRSLAKLSRPKKRRKREVENEKARPRGVWNNDIALVEVVEDERSCEKEDLSGLFGEEFKGSKWRGSTRLLLLDERYADKEFDEMPDAIKGTFREHENHSLMSTFELIKCKLTLFYDYWQMNEILEALLPAGMLIPSAFETVGHIAHLNLKDEHLPFSNLIAKVILDKNKPKIQTVVNKIDSIQNEYRTMQLEVLAGNHSLVTTVVENGHRFHVDLATVYWNSRLATERQRLVSCFTSDDVICDVFAGVGPISISAAKKVKFVYANDLNPYAVEYLERNCILNKVERKIEVFNMDGRRFINAIFTSERTKPITQVIMNLPNDAVKFLEAFKGIFYENHKSNNFLPMIHIYGFSRAQDPEFDFLEQIRIALSEVAFEIKMHRVRLVAPGKWMLCASFSLPERIAYAERVSVL